jgi:DNA-binding NarL/FixJ family response regulator
VFSTTHTVLIADDHALVRDGLKLIVSGQLPQTHFVEADDAASMFNAARATPSIRLALVDLNMPGMERGSRLASMAEAFPHLPLVVISALTSPDIVQRALEVPSVHAFVPKSASASHVRLAVDAALQGIKMLLPGRPESDPAEANMTPRMREIRSLLRDGKTNKQIARILNITEGTVKNRMTEIFRVLNVSNRTQAAQYDVDAL